MNEIYVITVDDTESSEIIAVYSDLDIAIQHVTHKSFLKRYNYKDNYYHNVQIKSYTIRNSDRYCLEDDEGLTRWYNGKYYY